MPSDPILQRLVPDLAEVPGIAAVALGGSRARGTATAASDYDVGLYFSTAEPLDTGRLRALACIAQVLFAANGRYLINEKGALQEAATFPRTIPDLITRTAEIWRSIGEQDFATTLMSLRDLERNLKTLA